MGQGKMQPARGEAERDEEVLCDLDAIIQRKATVILGGKSHVLESITMEAFLEFWSKITDYKKIVNAEDPKKTNKSYYDLIHVVCKTITPVMIGRLTLVQKAVLVEALCAKVIGNKAIFEQSSEKKKSLTGQSQPSKLALPN